MHEKALRDPDWFALWQDADASLATEDDATIALLRQAMEDDLRLIAKSLMTQADYDQEWFLSAETAIKGAWFGAEMNAARRQGASVACHMSRCSRRRHGHVVLSDAAQW
jgi:hypothetical protein